MILPKRLEQTLTWLSILAMIVSASMWISTVSSTATAADQGVKDLRTDIKQVPADIAVLKEQVADLKQAVADNSAKQEQRDAALLAALKKIGDHR